MPFFKRKPANGYQGSNSANHNAAGQSTSGQSTWGVQGNTAPVGWSPGAAPRPPQGPGNLHLQVPVPPTQPSSAGGFISPTLAPSPSGGSGGGGRLTPPGPQGNSSFAGGFAPQGPPPPIAPRNPQQDECYSWFVAIDQDGSGEISVRELQNALMNDNGLRFSASTVKYLMSIFDYDGSREIGFQEFEPLWNYIIQWRQMFESFDIDRNGKIDADELGRALAHYDLRVGPPVLDLLINKYAAATPRTRSHYGAPPPRPQIDLDRFVCACVVVKQMCQLYDQCSGYGAARAQINRDDFIRAVISLP